MQLGFVIDHSRCIGCHACTVACKAENDVPLGDFRTWVKYTEAGAFPEVKRSFAVLRCNQCTDAPCVTICPVKALEKRPDGIVDVDPAACIGCKACMQGCPYDALYLNEAKGTAEKCHFCAHRVEVGLAPACAVVCPTEAIVPGDFHDPQSVVSRLRKEHELKARKPEAATRPNVFYREVAEAAIDPLKTSAAGGYLWANRAPGIDLDAEQFEAAVEAADLRARARTTYDVDHPRQWGFRVSAYLFTKSLGAGIFMMLALLMPGLAREAGGSADGAVLALSFGALLFVALTAVLLVADLKRPARFLYVLLRPNWDSWVARGSVILSGYGAVLGVWCALFAWGRMAGGGSAPPGPPGWAFGLPGGLLLAAGFVLAALTACYTGWLFGQSRGRVLWMRRGLWLHLIAQALAAGSAFALLAEPLFGLSDASVATVLRTLQLSLVLHLLFVATEGFMAPARRGEEYRRAHRLVSRGPFAAKHYAVGMVVGVAVPLALSLLPLPGLWPVAGGLALIGLYVEEDILVRAGQAPAIS